MQQRVNEGVAIDLRNCERDADGSYVIPASWFQVDADYCDTRSETWIWSIGYNTETGKILGSVGDRFMHEPGWDCVWLR
jgi:hypothetical protein